MRSSGSEALSRKENALAALSSAYGRCGLCTRRGSRSGSSSFSVPPNFSGTKERWSNSREGGTGGCFLSATMKCRMQNAELTAWRFARVLNDRRQNRNDFTRFFRKRRKTSQRHYVSRSDKAEPV